MRTFSFLALLSLYLTWPGPTSAEDPDIAAAAAGTTWQLHGDGYQYAYRNGERIGAYDPQLKLWWPKINGEWAEPIPYDRNARTSRENFGLNPEWVKESRADKPEYVSIGGKPTTLRQAFDYLGASSDNKLPDLAGRAHVSIITDNIHLRDQVLRDFDHAPSLVAWKDKLSVSAYPATHWHLSPFSLGQSDQFRRTGFALLIQPAAGHDGHSKPKAIFAYAGPDDAAGALRRALPSYDPSKIEDVSSKLPKVPTWAYPVGAGVVIVGLAALKRRKGKK